MHKYFAGCIRCMVHVPSDSLQCTVYAVSDTSLNTQVPFESYSSQTNLIYSQVACVFMC